MATAPAPTGSRSLDTEYAVDFNRPIVAGGGAAYAATARESGRADLVALIVPRSQPPRADALLNETGVDVPGLMMPISHGRLPLPGGQVGYAVITQAPPGPAFTLPGQPLTEQELLENVMRPAAVALARLHARGTTHRNIRPDNLYPISGGMILGQAWTTPPGSLQPPAYDPPYSAMCLPGGRGEGVPADDIYALGAVLVALGTGRVLLAGLDVIASVRRRLALGSFTALLEADRLPPAVAELVRGMLADDPEHRPTAALLTDPVAARSRRTSARPKGRAAQELKVGTEAAGDVRTLAYALACQPGPAMALLETGAVDNWLRRDMGDAVTAHQVEDVLRGRRMFGATQDGRPDPHLVTRAIAVLDPLAPLCWYDLAWWPDALGPAMASATPAEADRIEQSLAQDVMTAWAELRPERVDVSVVVAKSRQCKALFYTVGPAGGRPRLLYTLNPLLPCASPALANACVCQLEDVLPALEAVAAHPEQRRVLPLDAELCAFLAARSEQHPGGSMAATIERPPKDTSPSLFQLRVLSMLQTRLKPGPLPGIAGWLLEHAAPALESWRNNAARAALEERLQGLVKSGQLAAMLAAIEDRAGQAADAQGAEEARAQIRALDALLQAIANGAPSRAGYADRLGQELAVGAGMTALAGALALMAFS